MAKKFTPEFKAKVIAFTQGHTDFETAQEFGIALITVQRWRRGVDQHKPRIKQVREVATVKAPPVHEDNTTLAQLQDIISKQYQEIETLQKILMVVGRQL